VRDPLVSSSSVHKFLELQSGFCVTRHLFCFMRIVYSYYIFFADSVQFSVLWTRLHINGDETRLKLKFDFVLVHSFCTTANMCVKKLVSIS
jgi:hypothetical protein